MIEKRHIASGVCICLLRWLGAASVCLAGQAAQAQVVITPVIVELGTKQRVASVAIQLSDRAKRPLRLQAEVLHWRQGLQGESLTEPAYDLLVTPPIIDLQPGRQQVFRIAMRGVRPANEELAYRLVLEDVAEEAETASLGVGVGIQFRMNYDLPVLIAPVGRVANQLRWKPCPPQAAVVIASVASAPRQANARSAEAPRSCVRVLNAGNRRIKVQTITLVGNGWQQTLNLKEGENVLVGTEREWRVPLSKGQTAALTGVVVQTAHGETLQAEAGSF